MALFSKKPLLQSCIVCPSARTIYTRKKQIRVTLAPSPSRYRQIKQQHEAATRYFGVGPRKGPTFSSGGKAEHSVGPTGSKFSFISNCLFWYSRKLETHPLWTKALTSCFIAGSGDLYCQYLVHRNNVSRNPVHTTDNGPIKTACGGTQSEFHPDWYRTGRFGILGFCLVAPVIHVWYGFLMTRIPGSTVGVVLKRTLLDQACFSPVFLTTFMTNLMILEGKPLSEIPPTLVENVPSTLLLSWSLWVPAMMFNFRFVPSKWQVLFSNMVGFFWNAILSWQTQEDHSHHKELREEITR